MHNDLKTFLLISICAIFIFCLVINKICDSKTIELLTEKNNVNNEKIDYIYNKIKEHSEGYAP